MICTSNGVNTGVPSGPPKSVPQCWQFFWKPHEAHDTASNGVDTSIEVVTTLLRPSGTAGCSSSAWYTSAARAALPRACEGAAAALPTWITSRHPDIDETSC